MNELMAGVSSEDLRATAARLAERGYALPPERLATLLPRGPHDPRAVLAAARADRALRVERGLVLPADAPSDLAARSAARQAEHAAHADDARALARAYARALQRHAPWTRAVLACGSLASGGYHEGDDVDVSLLVEDDAKHLAYVVALAVALPWMWRRRRRPVAPEARLPLLPKVVCVNVVWTTREATPFARTDDALALELLLQEPLVGGRAWADALARNPALLARYPQLAITDPPDGPSAPVSTVGRVLALLARSTRRRRALDALCYQLARALHALVRASRRKRPDVRARVARLEATKHPYAILDRPSRGRRA